MTVSSQRASISTWPTAAAVLAAGHENYPRELLQLFAMAVELNADGLLDAQAADPLVYAADGATDSLALTGWQTVEVEISAARCSRGVQPRHVGEKLLGATHAG
jgi:hypothetical protein